MKKLWLLIFLFGCATKPLLKEDLAHPNYQWETKALIENFRDHKSQNVNIDIYAQKNYRTRFEISAILGYQVASLVMSSSDIAYAIYSQKTFYYGRNSERAFEQILALPIHPMNLMNIAFDMPVKGLDWLCDVNTLGQPSHCENQQRKINIFWSDRNEGKKKVVITAPQFKMQWLFSAPQTEVQFKEDLFTLKQPSGFKAVQIN